MKKSFATLFAPLRLASSLIETPSSTVVKMSKILPLVLVVAFVAVASPLKNDLPPLSFLSSLPHEDGLVITTRRVYPEWPMLDEASWEVKISNPTRKSVSGEYLLSSLIPKDGKLAHVYASNNAESGRPKGQFNINSLFNLNVPMGETVAFYFNATDHEQPAGQEIPSVPCVDN